MIYYFQTHLVTREYKIYVLGAMPYPDVIWYYRFGCPSKTKKKIEIKQKSWQLIKLLILLESSIY